MKLNDEREDISQSLKVFIALSRVHRAVMNTTNKSIQSNGLNPTEFAVLELLYHKGGQPLQQIGERILIASGSITYVVDKLEKKGLVKRIPCPNDRRVIYAQLTAEGEAFIASIFPNHEKVIHDSFEMLTKEEKDELLFLLKKVGKYEK
ncbi:MULTISPECIES: MarR family winged helix-turn-helix transcriptional regulator [Bacillus cereus group]|uniref:MarR family transcriptional regulator n=1 Tax=Bacillus cereus TaxID=1396 RepID=A0AA44TCF4_BACCE|nr:MULTISPECIES: MarR family transcriptional regulator [Bacillus cereus group]EEL51669.1 Transcriptional regulator, MarR [Bacillus cereus Rock3-44]PFA18889.1 MarR family transcriptional regulator [Bacillus cereus]PFN10099.1 MarR family transcriptional regulator [Bacillus cereus]PFO84537.1 MarR family transcriptional regulator [Bacillus cereus]PFR29108.1 MarR family transcriptional regulator [Bacillus cereus]